jgi:pimeloyl-ACP methyl ester carboxylesterase
MAETPFQVRVGDGELQGHFGGRGVPALLLHGGPGLPDYLEGCAAELANLFTTIRYTQRGTPPSTVGPPYTIESHMADAIVVMDAFEQQKTWAIGHSWGGHLALHLAVAHPERLYGVVCIDGLGAHEDVLAEYEENLRAKLSDEDRMRNDEIEARFESGEVTDEELLEQVRILWPAWFVEPAKAGRFPIEHIGAECATATFGSIKEHFEKRTLARGLRKTELTVLFAHGMEDPLPLRTALRTAKLIPNARVARIPRAGHLPWVEQPGFLNRALRGLITQL